MTIQTPACTISSTGISAPTFNDIQSYFTEQYKLIMGTDAIISNDSKTGQLLAGIAYALNDCNNAVIQMYNGFSPTYSLGTNLSSLVQINGLSRKVSTKSTAVVRCTGVPGTQVVSGVVKDINGNLWDLASFTLPTTPDYIDVLATARDFGSIVATTGTINIINNPTLGWQTAISQSDATPGNPIETDYELRNRQAVSTAFPALATNEAIIAGALNIPGLTQAVLYENATDTLDLVNFLPPHSITLVTLGGAASDIAHMLAIKKSPGVLTNGTVTEQVTLTGSSLAISYSPAVQIVVICLVGINAFPGYTAVIGEQLKSDLAAYISSVGIGRNIYIASVVAAITRPQFNVANLTFTIISGATNDVFGNIIMPYSSYAHITAADVAISII